MLGKGNLQVESIDELSSLDLAAFPIAADFVIELIDEVRSSIRFQAPALGVTVPFPWWDDVKAEIGEWSLADIPCGSVESPYWDMDQGWHVLIWQSGERVYIAQGGVSENEYEVWFALPISLYRLEWSKAIQLAAMAGREG